MALPPIPNPHEHERQARAEVQPRQLRGRTEMTQDEIIEMARQAGGIDITNTRAGNFTAWIGTGTPEFLERFAKLVAQHEREACAWVCDSLEEQCEKLLVPDEKWPTPSDCANIIRARGQA